MGNLLVPHAWYVPANLFTTGLLLALAGGTRVGPVRPGLAAGLPIAGLLGLALAVAAHTPRLRPLLADRRMESVGLPGTLYRAIVRIPVGTVVLEEVAFRGVLLALLLDVVPTGGAVVVNAFLFGLWHVLPTQAALEINGLARRHRLWAIAGSVVAMTGVGFAFCWLRLATGGLVAPMIVHATANSGATVAAYTVLGGEGR